MNDKAVFKATGLNPVSPEACSEVISMHAHELLLIGSGPKNVKLRSAPIHEADHALVLTTIGSIQLGLLLADVGKRDLCNEAEVPCG